MSDLDFGSTRRLSPPLRNGLVLAIVAGVLTLTIQLVLTTSTFRRDSQENRRLRLTRTLNVLTILRDEIGRVQERITTGSLGMRADQLATAPAPRWPVQMWNSIRWNWDLLTIDTAIIKQVASLYDEILEADAIAESIRNSVNTGTAMAEYLRSVVPAEFQAKTQPAPSESIKGFVAAYEQRRNHIASRLPDVLTSLDYAIQQLRRELGP